MRSHPVRGLLCQGVPVSINPDDHGFFNSEGVTMDYLVAYLDWGLNLADLKQLCLNSLTYSSISEEDKKQVKQFFDMRWRIFLSYVRGKY